MGLDTVELIMIVENHYEIQIPDNEAENIATVQQLADYTFEKIERKPEDNQFNKTEIEQRVCEMIKDITELPLHEIERHSSFTNDLGMD